MPRNLYGIGGALLLIAFCSTSSGQYRGNPGVPGAGSSFGNQSGAYDPPDGPGNGTRYGSSNPSDQFGTYPGSPARNGGNRHPSYYPNSDPSGQNYGNAGITNGVIYPSEAPRIAQPASAPSNFWSGQSPQYDPRSSRFFPRPAVVAPQTFSNVAVGIAPAAGTEWARINNLLATGQVDAARQLIDSQIGNNRSLASYLSTVTSLQKAGVPADAWQPYRQEALALARQQVQQSPTNSLPWIAVAKFSLEDQQDQEFRQAVANLQSRFPTDMHTYYFNGIKELKDGNWKAAEQSLRLSQQNGMPAEDVGHLLKLAIDGQKWVWEYAQIVALIFLVWALGLALLFVTGRVLSGRVLRMVCQIEPKNSRGSARVLRMVYRTIIDAAGLYYYISLPVVTLLAIALPLAIGYAILILPFVSLPLVLMILVAGVGGILTAISGLRAAFVRVPDQLPGRSLGQSEAPAFWALIREVADKVGTRPIEEVWLTADATLAVVERGSYLRCWRDEGTRTLILGVAVLDGFHRGAFSSALAHEYGHFVNRDTAGGEVAMRVMAAMNNFAIRIVRRGPIRRWDVALQFLRAYHFLFRRISFGASRLQEVLADQVAVIAYGAAAFQDGLKHAIRRAIEFEFSVSTNYRNYLKTEAIAKNLSQLPSQLAIHDRIDIEEAIAAALHKPSTDDDTHPSPQERFQLATKVGQASGPSDERLVWDLIPNKDTVEEDVDSQLREAIGEKVEGLRRVTQRIIRQLTVRLKSNPSAECLFHRAEVYAEEGRHDEALLDIELLVQRMPNAHVIRMLRARVLVDAGRYSEAAQDIDRLLPHVRGREFFDFYLEAGRVYLKVDRHQSAVDVLTRAIGCQDRSLSARLLRGLAYQQIDQRAAERDFATAVKMAPELSSLLDTMRTPGIN